MTHNWAQNFSICQLESSFLFSKFHFQLYVYYPFSEYSILENQYYSQLKYSACSG